MRLSALVVLACLVVAVGCGGDSETVVPTTAERSAEPKMTTPEAKVEAFFTRKYSDADWYPFVKEVFFISDDRAAVSTHIEGEDAKAKRTAAEICEAVLASGLAKHGSVLYGNGPTRFC